MKTKHTPGPWVAAFLKNEIPNDVLGSKRWGLTARKRSGPILIAGVYDSCPNEHDARLIVAAPDLLEAAKALLDCPIWNGGRTEIAARALQAAIEKAEGRKP